MNCILLMHFWLIDPDKKCECHAINTLTNIMWFFVLSIFLCRVTVLLGSGNGGQISVRSLKWNSSGYSNAYKWLLVNIILMNDYKDCGVTYPLFSKTFTIRSRTCIKAVNRVNLLFSLHLMCYCVQGAHVYHVISHNPAEFDRHFSSGSSQSWLFTL